VIKHLREILNAFIMYKCYIFLRNIVRKTLAACKGRLWKPTVETFMKKLYRMLADFLQKYPMKSFAKTA